MGPSSVNCEQLALEKMCYVLAIRMPLHIFVFLEMFVVQKDQIGGIQNRIGDLLASCCVVSGKMVHMADYSRR